MRGHLGGVLAVAVSADGQKVLSGGRDGTVRLWDTRSGIELAQMAASRGWVQTVAFTDNRGWRVVAGGRDGRVIFMDMQARQQLSEMAHGGWLRALAVSSDGRTVYSSGDDRAVCAWNLATGERVARFTGHEGTVNGLALCGDGTRLVSASSDTSLLVWQVP